MADAEHRAEIARQIDGTERVLQRFIDSLQVLVLVLPPVGATKSDSRSLLVTAAARQALDDALSLRLHLMEASGRQSPESQAHFKIT